MPGKDNWDKCKIGFDITLKIIEIVLLGIVGLLIKLGADNIAQSLEKGKLVQILSDQLVATDAKRDIALIALNEAIPGDKNLKCTTEAVCKNILKHDQVFRVAEIVANRLIKDADKVIQSPNSQDSIPDKDEIQVVKEIIVDKTYEDYYKTQFGNRWDKIQALAHPEAHSDVNINHKPTPEQIVAKNRISEAAIAPTSSTTSDESLKDIKLVYIQYTSNKAKAEEIQKYLQSKGISAPGIEQIDKIQNDDIRYANLADYSLAKSLQTLLQDKQVKIDDNSLINLSEKGYKVPHGQLEIWLK